MSDREPGDWRWFCIIVGLFALVWSGGLLLTAGDAHGVSPNDRPPYGGCFEGWQAPQSEGAHWCREHQWVVRRHLVVSPSGQAQTDLRKCRQEDSTRCYWNAVKRGNGRGRGFVTAGKFRWYVDTINGDLASTNLLFRYDRKYR